MTLLWNGSGWGDTRNYPIVPWEPMTGVAFSLEAADGALILLSAALPTLTYFLMAKSFPNQQGPGRITKLRAYFNASDVLIWVSFTILLQLAFGSRTSCALWSLCTGWYLRVRSYHGPRPICAATTFFVIFGVLQFFLPVFHL